jgi:hypothetical protein
LSSGSVAQSGDRPGAPVGEAEADEALEVDGGAAVGPPELVAVEAAVTEPPVGAPYEPGDGAFDHGSMFSVGGLEVGGGGVRSGRGEQVVVGVGG